ncbi:RNA polymerase sigma factor [Planococcus sp. YIM B11945]|uniref:RNA polymerase sigma factor n=1 Tax=Planococcus sp. YIM B11945 TaxID=3435410 RepID=UPI003D7DB9A2
MEHGELFESAMKGERRAFAEWSALHHMPIARFGYQNGIGHLELQPFQLDVFRRFYNRLPAEFQDEHAAENVLVKLCIDRLPFHQKQDSSQEDRSIRFEEDREIHESIQQLPGRDKVLFTLFYFHGKTEHELSLLLAEPEDRLADSIRRAKELLLDKLDLPTPEMLEKRLQLLDTSYARFMPAFDETELFIADEKEEQFEIAPERKTPSLKRGAVGLIGAASLFLVGVIGFSFFMNEAEQESTAAVEEESTVITDNMVDEWRKEYKTILKTSADKLGLDQKTYNELAYVQQADVMFERTLKKSNIKKLKNQPEKMEHQINRVLRNAQTPKEMIGLLNENNMSAKEAAEFLHSFSKKTKELMDIYDGVFRSNQVELAQAVFNGELSADYLMAHKNQYSEEVRRVLDSLDEAMLIAAVHPAESKFFTRRNMDILFSNEFLNQGSLGYRYLPLLANEPYFEGTELLLPVETISYHLQEMEMFLLESEQVSSEVFSEYEFIFQHTFWLLLTGSESNPVFDDQGKVKEEYRMAWTNLTKHTGNPLIYMMLPILEEMKASGWTHSEHYSQLAYNQILDVLEMEKQGELAPKLPNGDVSVEPLFLDMKDFTYEKSGKLYNDFKKDYDLTRLQNVPPLDVLFLYHYANKKEDPETMWHLLADDETKPPLEEYMEHWIQEPDIAEEALWVEIYEESLYRMQEEIYLSPQINFHTEGMMIPPVPILTTKKDHIWQVKNYMYEKHSVAEEEKYVQAVTRLYKAFAKTPDEKLLDEATPGEIAGMFLVAAEKADYETMFALMEEPAQSMPLESFEQQIIDRNLPRLETIGNLEFSLDMFSYEYGQIWGFAKMDILLNSPDGRVYEELPMVKTEDGWRMRDITAY